MFCQQVIAPRAVAGTTNYYFATVQHTDNMKNDKYFQGQTMLICSFKEFVKSLMTGDDGCCSI